MRDNNLSEHRRCFALLRDICITATMGAMGTAMLILLIALVSELGLTGSAADWLATLSNSVVAIMAFFAARRWLPQLTTQEGYKLAIRLVNKEILTLDENNPFKQHVHGVVQEFTGLRRPEKANLF